MIEDRTGFASQSVDLDKIAKIAVDYYEALVSSQNGTRVDPEELISCHLSPQERQELFERLSDIDFLYQLTAPLRSI